MPCPTKSLLIAAGVTALTLSGCGTQSANGATSQTSTSSAPDRIYGQTNPPDDRLSRTSSPDGVSGAAGTGTGGVGSAASSAAGGTAGNSTGASSGIGNR